MCLCVAIIFKEEAMLLKVTEKINTKIIREVKG